MFEKKDFLRRSPAKIHMQSPKKKAKSRQKVTAPIQNEDSISIEIQPTDQHNASFSRIEAQAFLHQKHMSIVEEQYQEEIKGTDREYENKMPDTRDDSE